MYTFFIFIAVLLVLVLAHEFGHFIVARLSGMRVFEFGFGFPPRLGALAKIRGRWKLRGPRAHDEDATGTVYTLNLLPLGGFVRIKGENNGEPGADDRDSFASKKISRKIAVLLAGVIMNVVTAFVLLSIAYMIGVPEAVDRADAHNTPNRFMQVIGVTENSAGAVAGILPGDQVIGIGTIANPTAEQFRSYVQAHATEQIPLTIKRGKEDVSVAVQPTFDVVENRAIIGVSITDMVLKKYDFFSAIGNGAKTTGIFIREIVFGLGRFVASAFGGPRVEGEVAGPVGVAILTGEAARLGIVYLVQFAAVLSLNLAVLNVLPIPALDGGRLLFVIINKFKRKPVSPRTEHLIHTIAFTLLILLVILITAKDVRNLF